MEFDGCTSSKAATDEHAPREAVAGKTPIAMQISRDGPHKPAASSLTHYLQQNYDSLLTSNRRWIAARLMKTRSTSRSFPRSNNLIICESISVSLPRFLLKYRPRYTLTSDSFIGCSDSSVPANEIMNLDAGEVFVHRNLGNIVPNTDLNVMAVIEYAVAHLHIKQIIVCGHYDCSGVKAALSHRDMGILNPWLRNIRDAYRLHEAEIDKIKDEELKFRRLCEINVLESARNVVKTAMVQKAYYDHAYPIVHAWIFDMKNGTV